jgi:hypothetical protein
MFLVNWKGFNMKVYFTAEEMHTPEYEEYVRWVSNVWRLNDERNKRLKAVEGVSILANHDGKLPDDIHDLLEAL